MDVRRVKKKLHEEAAEVVVKLEVLLRMYKDLIRKGVGTNIVESEMYGIVHERVSGPTGHKMVALVGDCDLQKDSECESGEKREGSMTQCWREVALVRKLLTIRRRIIATQLRKARLSLSNEMKFLSAVSTKSQMTSAWQEALTHQEPLAVEALTHQEPPGPKVQCSYAPKGYYPWPPRAPTPYSRAPTRRGYYPQLSPVPEEVSWEWKSHFGLLS